MFFEGCPPQLGCTIKLRGASEYELSRVKEIITMMVYVAYHSQLEISFLMDEFAMPPSLSKSSSFPYLLESSTEEASANDRQHQNQTGGTGEDLLTDGDFEPGLQEIIKCHSRQPSLSESSQKDRESPKVSRIDSPSANLVADREKVKTSTPLSSQSSQPPTVSPPYLSDMEEILEEEVKEAEFGGNPEGSITTLVHPDSTGLEPVLAPAQLFRDPLQDDTGLFVAEQVTSTDDRLKSISACFRQELKDVILCISPFVIFREPFLLMPAGLLCPSRDYFPEQVYFSPLLNKDFKELDGRRKRLLLKEANASSSSLINGTSQQRPVRVLPSHKLTTARLTEQLGSSQGLARMLADYRAQGGRISRDVDPFAQAAQTQPAKAPTRLDSEEDKGNGPSDMTWATKVCLFVCLFGF